MAMACVCVCVQIRRPNNYDYNIAVTLGFTEPNPIIDLNQLEIVRTVVQDSPNKLFIGGLPCEWTEEQVSQALHPKSPLHRTQQGCIVM